MPFAYAGPEGQIGVVLVAGETLECDWYTVPRAQAKLVVTHFWCEEDVVILASCNEFDGEATVTLGLAGDPDDGNQIAVKTGEDGGVLIETAGAYEIVDFDYDWCFVDSPSADDEGRIVVGTEAVVVEIYSCGPLPIAGTE